MVHYAHNYNFHHHSYIELPTSQEALAYLNEHQMPALQRLAREHITADRLREHAVHHGTCFGEEPVPSPAEISRGKVDIWTYAARVLLHLQESISDAEAIVIEHDRLVAAGYQHDFPAHAVAAQIDWFLA